MALTKVTYSMIEGVPVNVQDLGAIGDGVADDTAAIQAAVDSGYGVFFPQGTYKVTTTIECATQQNWSCSAPVTIKYAAASGTAIKPVIDFKDTVTSYGQFIIDHSAGTINYLPPTVYSANVIAGSAILVQGDWSNLDGWKVINAWDNGIAVVKLNPSTGVAVNGSPKYCSLSNIKTQACGVGEHVGITPGKIGAGIDVASASASVVSNCVDFESYLGFILDIGAGAQCQFSNCTAWFTKNDAANPTNGSGYGFYVGSPDSTFVNCYSVGSEYRGWWIDTVGVDLNNCVAEICKQEGFLIKGSSLVLNIRVKGASQAGVGLYPAVLFDSSAAPIVQVTLNLQTTSDVTSLKHSYAVDATGANQITAFVSGFLTGVTGTINYQTYNIGSFMVEPANGRSFQFDGVNEVSSGQWDTGSMKLGGHYFWVDSLGKLRIKFGAPTSDTDGTVVGTQT